MRLIRVKKTYAYLLNVHRLTVMNYKVFLIKLSLTQITTVPQVTMVTHKIAICFVALILQHFHISFSGLRFPTASFIRAGALRQNIQSIDSKTNPKQIVTILLLIHWSGGPLIPLNCQYTMRFPNKWLKKKKTKNWLPNATYQNSLPNISPALVQNPKHANLFVHLSDARI